MDSYAVVTFTAIIVKMHDQEEKATAEIPSCWLSSDLTQCWWPKVKDVRSFITKRVPPVPTNSQRWELFDIIFEGYFDQIKKGFNSIASLTVSIDALREDIKNIQRNSCIPYDNAARNTYTFEELKAKLPVKLREDALEFDATLEANDVRKTTFMMYLKTVGGSTVKECITRMFAKTFSLSLASSSSWCGQRGNFKVGNLEIVNAILEAVRELFPACTDKEFETEGKEWFRQGSQKNKRLLEKSQ